jgi:hypothetical protein
MIGVFFDQDHRQQARPGKAASDHVERRRRLRDRLARPAAELLAHVLGDEPLPRDNVERLGDLLADLRELGAAAAGARCRCRMNDTRSPIGSIRLSVLWPINLATLIPSLLGSRAATPQWVAGNGNLLILGPAAPINQTGAFTDSTTASSSFAAALGIGDDLSL